MPQQARTKYIVGVSNAYFPADMKQPLTEFAFLCKVYAISRVDAATKVWDKFGGEWLTLMPPKQTRVRKISLHVDDPAAGATGLLGRLIPIEVYID
jgi:hypothetical protein